MPYRTSTGVQYTKDDVAQKLNSAIRQLVKANHQDALDRVAEAIGMIGVMAGKDFSPASVPRSKVPESLHIQSTAHEFVTRAVRVLEHDHWDRAVSNLLIAVEVILAFGKDKGLVRPSLRGAVQAANS